MKSGNENYTSKTEAVLKRKKEREASKQSKERTPKKDTEDKEEAPQEEKEDQGRDARGEEREGLEEAIRTLEGGGGDVAANKQAVVDAENLALTKPGGAGDFLNSVN